VGEISFTGWEQGRESTIEVSGDSFRALFDRRFPDKLNEAIEDFFRAYAKAVKDARNSDRFPNLKEVQEKMEKGEVYNIKKRLIDKTDFFYEVSTKTEGTFLLPKAKEFADAGGRYTNLVFDFDKGDVLLPKLAVEGKYKLEDFRQICFSEWKQKVKSLKGVGSESFRALFDARKPEKVNEIVEEFLRAYARAVKETIKEDRFPNLQEIKNKMERGEIYNVKKRVVENSEFFHEVDMKGLGVFLLPSAVKFADAKGKYTDLAFDFENGEVLLPKLKTVEIIVQKVKTLTLPIVSILVFASILSVLVFFLLAPATQPIHERVSVFQQLYTSRDSYGDFLAVEMLNPQRKYIEAAINVPSTIGSKIGFYGGEGYVGRNSSEIRLTTEQEKSYARIYFSRVENISLTLATRISGVERVYPTVNGTTEYEVKSEGNMSQIEILYHPGDKMFAVLNATAV
jgi:hypothetical protein